MTCVRSGGNKPPLDPLPLDPRTARASEIAATFNAKADTPHVLQMMAAIRLLLADGPMKLPEIVCATKVRYDQAMWALRRMNLAGEIKLSEGKRWQLVVKVGV